MTFIPCSRRIYAASFRIPLGFMDPSPLTQNAAPHIRYLIHRLRTLLPTPFGFHLAVDTLLFS